MFKRDVLDKPSLIHRLESMQHRHTKHGDTFSFDVYLGLTFASHELVDELAPLVRNNNQGEFANRMNIFQDRFRNAPMQIKRSLVYYLGRQHGKLESFDDLPEILDRLKG